MTASRIRLMPVVPLPALLAVNLPARPAMSQTCAATRVEAVVHAAGLGLGYAIAGRFPVAPGPGGTVGRRVVARVRRKAE